MIYLVNALLFVAYVSGGIALEILTKSPPIFAFYGYAFGLIVVAINVSMINMVVAK